MPLTSSFLEDIPRFVTSTPRRSLEEQMKAHMRLMSILPVRTHKQPMERGVSKTRSSPQKVVEKLKRITALKASGLKPRQIARELGMSRQMVHTYLKRVG